MNKDIERWKIHYSGTQSTSICLTPTVQGKEEIKEVVENRLKR